ncbi:glycoside hydrolase family 43 protein [Amanita muscaria Koide BX008]|uniref:Glycoside hydrolase family 43 protein n=1 Tax=Amanita muscaria (strain Koide BX008) TaxID=946122 RepID=A0A0C2X2U5_AMAMK|nr:glycoside hydrolase family 43 protein [Amanita muscaria Koide BX008]
MTGILLQLVVTLSVVATSAAQNSSSNVNDDPAQPLFPESFADPAFVKDPKTNYFWAFSTSGPKANVQVTLSTDDFNTFTFRNGTDALPHPGNWTASPPDVWAPDVVLIENLRSPFDNLTNKPGYVMYYSANSSQKSNMHCASPKPLVCPLDQGGAIDPSGFRDPATGKQYVTYKVDANSIGSGGACGNSVVNPKQKATPIRIQEVDSTDGTTLIGNYVEIENAIFPEDVAYVEAPSLLSVPWLHRLLLGPELYGEIRHQFSPTVAQGPLECHWHDCQFYGNTTGLHGGSSNTSTSTSSTSASLATTTGSGATSSQSSAAGAQMTGQTGLFALGVAAAGAIVGGLLI